MEGDIYFLGAFTPNMGYEYFWDIKGSLGNPKMGGGDSLRTMVINFKSNYWRVKPRARIVDGQWHVIIPYFVWCNTGSLSTDYSCTTCNYGEKRSSIRYTINHHSQRLLVELTVVRSGAVTIWSSKGVIHYNRDNSAFSLQRTPVYKVFPPNNLEWIHIEYKSS